MGINRHKPHLVIYLEDKPYRDIINGVKQLPNVNDYVIKSEKPCGGCEKVFDKLKENLKLIKKYENMYVLVLMDFDDKFKERYDRFYSIVQDYKNRVFILGIDKKESEDLKKTLKYENYEEIGKLLAENCPHETSSVWDNEHLNCNKQEIENIKNSEIKNFLFKVGGKID